jgi:HD-like signal output (HDOD) protein
LGIDRTTPPPDPELGGLAGVPALDPVAAAAAKLRARFRDPGYRAPALPAVALALQEGASASDASFAAISALLQSDPAVTARVLRLARSAPRGRVLSVRSLSDAVGQLGLRAVVELVWCAALEIGLYRQGTHRRVLDQLRRHGLLTAHLARAVALAAPVPVEHAFLAGLVHDAGLAAALILLAETEAATVPGERDIRAVAAVHQELSARVARLWNLPEDVQVGLAQHHQLGESGPIHPLAAVIVLAEHLALSLGAPQPLAAAGWDPLDRQRLRLAHTALQLSPAQLKLIEAEARTVLADLEA